ncbi:salivaricin A modification enzyme [Streptococcus pyogenes]|nr:salivaricin A modification enzyme [Streptococcus pyogenes]VGZ25206.1 salivaricin A modification enzyme [Streptococcus pyogenes]VGZ30817.1 salivaricin A modification enzyme [Streptococcus pyogenes]VHF90800.1 salivaricin A modification enzyme [Streptococcus pyogenes]VHG14411.1 salivaricin A modification enzyme [Streptococcus pyogenes]
MLRKKTHKLFYSEFENQLFETIMFLSMKTLVLDINHFSKEIENKSEAYEQCIQQIREENGINHFFDRYPYLLKQINKEVGLIEESYSLLFDRFLEDLSEIRSCFNISEPLSNVAFSLGDSHSKKQTVVKIAFKEKSVYYKPKSYHSHSILLELTSLLKSSNIPSFSLPKSLVKADYCWQLGVAYTSSNKDEVAKIYFKYGVLAAFSEIFSITDLHMENVIVSGGDLYLIDVETFFQRKLNVQNQNFEGITVDTYQRIYETSLSNGLFPVQFEKNSAPNVSGISGKGGKRKKGKYELINKNRGDMKLVKVDYFQEDGFNIPTLNGKVVEPLDYANEIISGFRECYIFLIPQRSKIKEIVQGFPELKSRALFRNTSDYGKFLQASTNPKYLFSEKKRKNLFSILYDAKHIEHFIVDNEIKDLMNGDIPYFSMDTRGNVYNSVGTLIGNLGDTTSLFDSITILNDERLKFTCELLEIVLKKPIKHWEREKGKSYQFLSISSEHYLL